MIIFRLPAVNVGLAFETGDWLWWTSNILIVQNVTRSAFILGPTWSLSYEIQMYLLLPFIYREARKKRALWSLAAIWVAAGFSSVVIKRLFIAHYGLNYDDSLHGPVTYFVPCFLGGVFAYVIARRIPPQLPALALPVTIGLFFCCILSSIRFADWFACTGFGLGVPLFLETQSRILVKAAQLIAKYSYGIYLVHAPIYWLIFTKTGLPTAGKWMLAVGAISLVSIACYRWIEEPMIGVGHRLANRSLRENSLV